MVAERNVVRFEQQTRGIVNNVYLSDGVADTYFSCTRRPLQHVEHQETQTVSVWNKIRDITHG